MNLLPRRFAAQIASVGFIGLGQMGLRMARNLGRKTALVVHDINAATAKSLAAQLANVSHTERTAYS